MALYLETKLGKSIITEDGKLNFSKEELQESLEFIQSLEDNHVIPTMATIIGNGTATIDQNEDWIAGKIAGVFEWDSAISKCKKALAEGQELVVRKELTNVGIKSTMFAIKKNSEHPHEAAMLLNYMMNDSEGVKILGISRGIPASKIAYDTLQEEGALNPFVNEAHQGAIEAGKLYWSPLFDNPKLKGSAALYTQLFDALSYHDMTVEEGAETLYNAYREVCDK